MCAGQAGEVFMANVFKTQEITHYTPKTLPNSTTPKNPLLIANQTIYSNVHDIS